MAYSTGITHEWSVTVRLDKYIENVGERAASELFGVKRPTVYAWRTGRRKPQPEKAKEIERVTGGKVKFAECY